MGRKDGPWTIKGITTVEKGWFGINNREPLETRYPACFWCGLDQENPSALLVTVKISDEIKTSGWFCESCARERNLIW